MKGGQKLPALDGFRLVAAFLVVCIHTSPFASWTELGDFWLTRVLARVAVPFFFMTSGYFLACSGWRGFGRTVKKLLLLYGCAILLYLPLNWYNGGFTPLQWLQKLLVDGTFYHLWYFPAVLLGLLIARQAARLGMPAALILAIWLAWQVTAIMVWRPVFLFLPQAMISSLQYRLTREMVFFSHRCSF